jgi:hypothetical protein
MTPAALAHRAGCPPARLDGLVAKLQRLLNMDGYEVLRLDRRSDAVVLNAGLRRRQFELKERSGRRRRSASSRVSVQPRAHAPHSAPAGRSGVRRQGPARPR